MTLIWPFNVIQGQIWPFLTLKLTFRTIQPNQYFYSTLVPCSGSFIPKKKQDPGEKEYWNLNHWREFKLSTSIKLAFNQLLVEKFTMQIRQFSTGFDLNSDLNLFSTSWKKASTLISTCFQLVENYFQWCSQLDFNCSENDPPPPSLYTPPHTHPHPQKCKPEQISHFGFKAKERLSYW